LASSHLNDARTPGGAAQVAVSPGVFPYAGVAAIAFYVLAVTGRWAGAVAAVALFSGGLALALRGGLRAEPASCSALGRNLAIFAMVAVFCDGVLGAALRGLGPGIWTADIRLLHRVGALTVAASVLAASVVTFVGATRAPGLRRLALLPPLVVGLQGLLGALSAGGSREGGRFVHEAHLAAGPALLGLLIALVALSSPPAALAPWRVVGARTALRAGFELTKPRVTGLVVTTFAGGLWLAPGTVPAWRAWITLVGTVLIVGAANALNMYLERDVDGLMRRTSRRPLPERRLPAEFAVAVGAALACTALPLLVIGGNLLVGALGFVAFVSYVWMYTPLKRVSPLALWVGAVPGAMPPLMGWATGTGRLDVPGLVLFSILFLWQIPHFLGIAIFRGEEYARAGIKVMSLERSPRATRFYIVSFTLATLAATLALQPLGVTGWPFTIAATALWLPFARRAFYGLRRFADAEETARWAKGLFFSSIIYLGLLFVALAVDRVIG
jgi:protoheme IX farnesyltransferase